MQKSISDRCCNKNANEDRVYASKNPGRGSGGRRSVQLAGSTSDSIAQRRSLMMQQSVRNGFTVVDLDCARGEQWLSCYVQDTKTN